MAADVRLDISEFFAITDKYRVDAAGRVGRPIYYADQTNWGVT